MRGGGGVVQNREFPDFRSPEVGRYVGPLECSEKDLFGPLLSLYCQLAP